ncbi:MAG: hypothetical protein BroJett018_54290 [Chloroflexota bacterium]|nr:MAG: hypothetical protein BroJett018_54290 [Chloroflexota bacterium]
MTHLFISYSRSDQEFARCLASNLQARGLDVFWDIEDIHAGMDWSDSIQQGLDSSQIMLLIISPASMRSQQVGREWKYFLSRKKPILPILWQPADLHYQLNALQHINFQTQAFEIGLQQLLTELGRYGIHTTSLAAPPPPTPVRHIATSVPKPKRTSKLVVCLGVGVIGGLIVVGFAAMVLLLGLLKSDDRSDNAENDGPTGLLAYTRQDVKQQQVWLEFRNMATGETFSFSERNANFEGLPEWSPDGTLVTYWQVTTLKFKLLVTNWGGNPTTFFESDQPDLENFTDVQWSPSSRTIAYTVGYDHRDSYDHESSVMIYDIGTDTTLDVFGNRIIGTDLKIAWGENDRLAILLHTAAGYEVYLWTANDGVALLGTLSYDGTIYDLDWFPDQSALLLTGKLFAEGTFEELMRVPLAAPTLESYITLEDDTTVFEADAAFSPDGALLAYVAESRIGRCGQIKIVRVDGKRFEAGVRVEGENVCMGKPLWSPDSNSLAFIAYESEGGEPELWVFRVFNGSESLLGQLFTGYAPPTLAWSPDGSALAYMGVEMTDEGLPKVDLYLASMDNPSEPTRLTDNPVLADNEIQYIQHLAWQPTQ